jgi:membrane-bound lytic murein transglycosylase D
MIKQMPKNPQDRNFWQLMKRFKIPQETYDYVFLIVAAAVIGENPQLFGFDYPAPFPNSRSQ